MSHPLIADAKLVNEGRRQDAAVRIRDGRIDAIAAGPVVGETVFDAGDAS